MNNLNEEIEEEASTKEKVKDWATLSDEARAAASKLGIIAHREQRLN